MPHTSTGNDLTLSTTNTKTSTLKLSVIVNLNLVISILPLKFFPRPHQLIDKQNNRSPRAKSQLSAAVSF